MQNVLLRSILALFAGVSIGVPTVTAAMITASATDYTDTTASGQFNGIGWQASTSADAPFLGINLTSGQWDVAIPLPLHALMLTASHVNAGDFQEFIFDSPISDGYFYIENFDSSSVANITTDATSFQLLGASASITYSPTDASEGVLETSNDSYDGEGDAVFRFLGPLTRLRLDFTDGTGANGLFYGFSQDDSFVNPVPEPAAFVCIVIGVMGLGLLRRRINSRGQ